MLDSSRQWLARRGAAGDSNESDSGRNDKDNSDERNNIDDRGDDSGEGAEPPREEDDSPEEERVPFFRRLFHSSTEGMDLSVLLKVKKDPPFLVSVIGDRAVVVCMDRNAKSSFFQSVFRDGPSFLSCESEVRSIHLMKYIQPDDRPTPETEIISSVIESTLGKKGKFSPPHVINLSDPLAVPLKEGFVGLDFPVYGHTTPFPFMMVKTDPSMVIPHYEDSSDDEEQDHPAGDPPVGEALSPTGPDSQGEIPEAGPAVGEEQTEEGGEEKPKYFHLIGRVLWSEDDIRSFFGCPKTEPVSEELLEEAADYIRGFIWRYCRVLARQVNTVYLLRRKRDKWQIVRSNNQIYSTFFLDPEGDKEVLHFISGYFDNYWGRRLFLNLALVRPDDLKVVEHLQRVARYWE